MCSSDLIHVWSNVPTTLIIRSSDTEYVDQCVTLTPSSVVSLEQAPLVSGVEKINGTRRPVVRLPPLLALGGLRGRNPLLVVSCVTTGEFPNRLLLFVFRLASHGITHHHANIVESHNLLFFRTFGVCLLHEACFLTLPKHISEKKTFGRPGPNAQPA